MWMAVHVVSAMFVFFSGQLLDCFEGLKQFVGLPSLTSGAGVLEVVTGEGQFSTSAIRLSKASILYDS